ncbi:GNAT family N-acetyltransferase [Geothrix edaphica]|uniref:BioF2-like acetyltransferase domain-containing protein n=1 Tax=Geothrix edaphica TaxID=2927976 RepID=A0ABQ5PV90_9BACT|nr:GNAT family N-acetyltransferase [Geothrix edaphica]GLH66273.1 hypothetical protein GETHED_06370 [Geothrix edaphica]
MNAEIFAEWLRRQGHKVLRSESSYWFNAGPGVFQAFPYHWLIKPGPQEIRWLMMMHSMIALRYSTPLDHPGGKVSYHVVLRKPYDLTMLKSQARNGVKSGLKHFQIEQVSFERLATEGWVLQEDTLRRQGRLRSMTRKAWERLCRAAVDLQGFEAWAATANGQLAAAVIVCRMDDWCYIPYSLSHSSYLGQHPNNALFFTVSCNLLDREGVSGIFFTVQSLDAPAQVDEFKFRMGFLPVVACQQVAFSPLLRPFANSLTHAVIRRLYCRFPSSPSLAKAEGILRFHLDGARPPSDQAWPECLSELRSAALEAVASPGPRAPG